MTLSASVGRRRQLARRALLHATTILAAGTTVPAMADIVPPKIYTLTLGGINVADGAFTYKQVDLAIGTLELERFHDAAPAQPRDPDTMFFGWHTSNNFDIFVVPTYVPQKKENGTVTQPVHYHAIVHLGSASSGTYYQSDFSNNSSLLPDDGSAEQGTLGYVNGVYTYVDQFGTVYHFASGVQVAGTPGMSQFSQRVSSIVYPDGRVRTFGYANGKLKLVSDSTGYAIAFDYNSSGLVSAACGFNLAHDAVNSGTTCTGAMLKTQYGYSGTLLTSVTDVIGKSTTYAYAGNGSVATWLSCITPPSYTTCKITNNYPDGQHLDQTLADGGIWHVSWASTLARDENYLPEDGDNSTNVTDPTGKTSTYIFTGSTPYGATDANLHSTSYRFVGGVDTLETVNPQVHVGSLLTEVDLPEGNTYLQDNSGPYHAIAEQRVRAKPKPDGSPSSLPDEIAKFGYACTNGALTPTCTKPTVRLDSIGSQAEDAGIAAYYAGDQTTANNRFAEASKHATSWSYTSFGAPAWELQPPPTDGAARPLKLYTYAQKYASVLNAQGLLSTASAPVWLPATEVECQTVTAFAVGTSAAEPTCDAAAPHLMTTYEYGADGSADNLLLRGKVVSADGQSYRTCYRYDRWSNRIAETKPRAGLTSCPADDQPNP